MEVITKLSPKDRIYWCEYWKGSRRVRSAVVKSISMPLVQYPKSANNPKKRIELIGCISYHVSKNLKSKTKDWNGGVIRDSDIVKFENNNEMKIESIYNFDDKVFYMENNKIVTSYIGMIQFPNVSLINSVINIGEINYHLRRTKKGMIDYKNSVPESLLFKSKKDLLKSL